MPSRGSESAVERSITETPVDRRQLLQALGITGLSAGFSGCGGTREDTGGPSGESGESRVLRVGAGQTFAQADWNLFNPTRDQPRVAQWLFLQPLYYLQAGGEWRPGLVSEYDVSGTTATFDLAGGYTWHDGTPVTAEDFVVQYGIEEHFDHPAWGVIESISAPEDEVFQIELTEAVNERVLLFDLFHNYPLQSPRSVFGEYYERFADATTDSERSTVKNDLVQFRWNEPVGTGPFEFASYNSSSEMACTPFADYPIADEFEYDRVHFVHYSNDQQLMAGMLNGRIHCRWAFGLDIDALHERGGTNWELRKRDVPRGRMWVYNHDHKWWGQRDVRRGLAYLHDQEEILNGAPEDAKNKDVLAHPTTQLPDGDVERYLGDVTLEDYSPTESRPEKAREAFERAGWSREDGTWYDENADEVVFQCRSGATQTVMNQRIQVMNSINQDFGLTSELVTMEGSAYWNDFGEGNFPIQWAGWQALIPTKAFQSAVAGPIGQNQLSVSSTLSVPDIGDVGGEDAIDVDVEAQVRTMTTAQDDETFAEAVRTLGWACNQIVPAVPLYVGQPQLPIDTAAWDWPPKDDPRWSTNSPVAYMAQIDAVPRPK